MAYIYLITNKINGKQYVGKTENTIDERWKEHIKDSKKERYEKRPLYDAIQKYGIDNFEIKELEYLKEGGELLSNREIYWIKQLKTYGHNGYNATIGGDGSTLYNYEEIVSLYKELGSIKKVSKHLNCTVDTVRKVLDKYNIDLEKRKNSSKSKIIEQYSLEEKLLNIFESERLAAKYIISTTNTISSIDKIASNIGRCALGKRKTAYKFIWKFKN